MSSPKIFQIWTALVKRDDQNIYDQRPIVIWGFQGDKVVALKCTTNLNTNIAHLTLNKNHAGLKEDTVVELKRFYLIPKTKLLKYRGNLSFENKLDLIGKLDRNFPKEVIMQEKLILNESLFEEYNESDNNLTEAKKKRKKKKISQVNPGEAIFKSVKDMQKWVKKRQKGMGYFVHMDCGNMDYNNDMFNKMHGLGDTSSSSTADGGASDAAPSGGEASVGMGESLEINEVREPKPDRSFVETAQFQNSWKQNGLNDEDLRDLQNKIMTEPPEADLQGGLYKFRFAPKRESRGQREAYRTIYYDFQGKKTIYLLYCFPKQEKANLSETQLKYLRELSKLIRGRK